MNIDWSGMEARPGKGDRLEIRWPTKKELAASLADDDFDKSRCRILRVDDDISAFVSGLISSGIPAQAIDIYHVGHGDCTLGHISWTKGDRWKYYEFG